MTITDVLERLASQLDRVKYKNGGPGFMARCPAHEDVEASLSVDPGTRVDGVVLHCFAGCDTERILAAMGLTAADLFTDQGSEPSGPPPQRRIVETYDYRGERGDLLTRVLRYDPKDFRQCRPKGDGTWDFSLNGTRRVLYRLPELMRAKADTMIVVVEGEKDCDRVRREGFTATCHAGGTGNTKKMLPAYVDALTGRHVAIIPENDDPGRDSAKAIAGALRGHAASVRVVKLAGLPPKGDVSDWLDGGHTADQLRVKINQTKEWALGDHEPTSPAEPATALKVVRLDQVQERPVDWLWPGWLARRELSIHAASPGLGKTTVSLALTAAFSTGGTLPDGAPAPLVNVLLMLSEDSLETTIAKGLRLHGADPSRVYYSQAVLDQDGTERAINLDKHLPQIEQMVKAHDIGLVILDPLTGFSQGTDRNNEGAVRDTLTPLRQLAERYQFAVLGIAHFGKPNGSQRNAMQSVLGSTGYVALARTVIASAELPEAQQPDGADLEPGLVRITQVVKSNLDIKPSAITWRRPRDCPITWLGTTDLDVETVLSTPRERDTGTRDQAKAFLTEELHGGSKPVNELRAAAEAEGISWATLRRAKDDLGIKPFKLPNLNGAWFWHLPSIAVSGGGAREDAHPPIEDAHHFHTEQVSIFNSSPSAVTEIEDAQREHVSTLAEPSPNWDTGTGTGDVLNGHHYDSETSKVLTSPYMSTLSTFDSSSAPEPETETFVLSLYP